MVKTYPARIGNKTQAQMGIFENFDGGESYDADYKKALRYAKKIDGQVYTVVDAGGTKVYYLKGNHFVNRLGYVVVKWSE